MIVGSEVRIEALPGTLRLLDLIPARKATRTQPAQPALAWCRVALDTGERYFGAVPIEVCEKFFFNDLDANHKPA